ncbi:MAG: sigma-70 family RNA polymerase sigma factor [Planctomycetes bacterium]|nr:sigma-70 family RNA polymerase sigma factor [Planctomycetota bacterium]
MPEIPAWLTSLERHEVPPPATTAIGDLLLAEQPRLRRLVHRLLGWPTQAAEIDDVVQDVLLQAWRHRAAFRGDAALATWLAAIGIRAARSHVRRRQWRQRLLGWLPGQPEPLATPVPCRLEHDERRQATHAAMQQLAHGDREILVLRYLENREPAAIAELLGIGRAAVDQRLSRARARLRVILDREERP